MREIKYSGFNNEEWLMTIDFDGIINVTNSNETREYKIDENITKIEHNTEYVFVYVEGGNFYQFKFEVDNFFVGDIFDENGEHIDTFANYVFGIN
jgi:phosphomevalonate kinase